MKNCAALAVMHLSLMRIGLRFMPELSFRKTSTITQACNIPSQEVIFSDVFLMLCQIGGDVPCSKEENRYRPLKKKRAVRPLSSFDYLMGIDDSSRMGGFRFKKEMEGDYINVSPSLKIPH